MMLPTSAQATEATKPSSLHIRISMGCSMFARRCGNGMGMGTTRAVMGGDGESMQQSVREQVGDGDKNIFCGR